MSIRTISVGLISLACVIFLFNIITSVTRSHSTAAQAQTASAATAVEHATSLSNSTLAEVQQHANRQSCWTAINGRVYDLTSWIPRHPGGSMAIMMLCGKDGSQMFNIMHGGQRRPSQQLTAFQIGTLSQS